MFKLSRASLKKYLKPIILIYICLGFVLSFVIGIEYDCGKLEMFPIYYGSPFVFKQKSLATSMEYFYSISGLVLNVFVWSIFLFFIDKFFQNIFSKILETKWVQRIYKLTIAVLIAYSTISIFLEYMMLGNGFDKNRNYWYWDIDKEAKYQGIIICKGELIY
jgi:hypothetical protein